MAAGGALGCEQLLGLDEDRSRIADDGGGSVVCACDDGNPCTVDSCTADGCAHVATPNGVAPEQVTGDCQRLVCEDGVPTSVADDRDVAEAEACRVWSCVGGTPLAAPRARGERCELEELEGAYCDGAGACVECVEDDHCGASDTCGGGGTPGVCGCAPLGCDDMGLTCGAVSDGCDGTLVCDNAQLDGTETDVDCGGSVSTCGRRCALGLTCAEGDDCQSGFCGGARCDEAWSTPLAGGGTTSIRAVATHADGAVVLVGDFVGSATLGGNTLQTATSAAFLALLEPNGAARASLSLGDGTSAFDAAFDPAGNVVIVGSRGGRPHVEKRDANGHALWTMPLAIEGTAVATSVATAAGRIFVLGVLDGALSVGSEVIVGADDLFLLELDSTGATLDATTIPSIGLQRAVDVAVGPAGQLAIAAEFIGTVDIGEQSYTSTGDWDGYLTVLDVQGAVKHTLLFTGSAAQQLAGVVYDGAGNLFVAGTFFGAMQLEKSVGSTRLLSGELSSMGAGDVFVARLGEALGVDWLNRYGDVQHQEVVGLAPDARGGVAIGGSFNGSLAFGGSPLTSAGGTDVFFATLDAGGGTTRSQRFGDQQAQHASAIAMSAFGAVFLTGSFRGTVDFGQGPMTSAAADQSFVAAF